MNAPTLRQTVEGLVLGYVPGAPGERAVLGFEAAGERPRHCHLVIDGAACRFVLGPAPAPTAKLRTDGATLRAIGAGELEVAAAVAQGRLAAEGDAGALHLLGRFRRVNGEALLDPVGAPPGLLRLPPMAWMTVALLPWAALWAGLYLHRPHPGAQAGLGLALLVCAYRAVTRALTFFEVATTVALAGAVVLPDSLPGSAISGASFAALSTVWALGAAARALGLSGEYTRWRFIRPLAATALFRYPNVRISLAWAAGFLVNALVAVFPRALHLPPTAVHAAVFTACAFFTSRVERGASEVRIDDIDRRLAAVRRQGWLVAAAGVALVVLALGGGSLGS